MKLPLSLTKFFISTLVLVTDRVAGWEGVDSTSRYLRSRTYGEGKTLSRLESRARVATYDVERERKALTRYSYC
ncbi:hypothetical protein F4821DRAFT_60633 [Hypoxylon rubiginosum]|uniref:Uncharacterized protein n=1 Tax=Hypoxylon rubiginosum TaxID=110542 RepID=A0ACC0D963_9PEZI|nr:hypothetical protein F4821DRAFT_60633 [Hypoxylon rubiginosum]